MCCMGVAMICVGATYDDDVSTYLIVGGIFVFITSTTAACFSIHNRNKKRRRTQLCNGLWQLLYSDYLN